MFALLIVVCGTQPISYAEIPHLINYQGKLADSDGSPLNGSYNVTFRIYDAESGGSLLWQEAHAATIEKGIFSIMLGGITALSLPFNEPYFLSIQVAGDPEMTPRQRITSAGYAFRAEEAENANKISDIEASATPEANKLLPLGDDAKLPGSVLKSYDSGWLAITPGSHNTITIPHNLNTQKVIYQAYVSDNNDGTGYIVQMQHMSGATTTDYFMLQSSTVNTLVFAYRNIHYVDTSGNRLNWSSGTIYCKVAILALE